ncbi:MAG: 6,7-dimethyl-8-ribityllumazine synthase [Ignavibacteriales bacterium]|nr:6,7-dimethyl-8-ribityllumazine synthase [Ignavibacteriales bacterium]
MNIIEGQLIAKPYSFAIAVSRFNSTVTEKLLSGVVNCLLRHGAEEKNITAVWCPGAFEIAQVAQSLVSTKKFDAVICLGCIVRGETPHFDHLASATTRSIAELAEDCPVPMIYGVLTTDTMEQAMDRAGGKNGNKGWDAALASLEMIDVLKRITKKK